MKKFAALTLIIILALSLAFPAYAAGAAGAQSAGTVLKLASDSSVMNVNGASIQIEKPYIKGKTLYIPLRSVLESMGADVLWLGNNSINVVFRDVSINITVGKADFEQNQVKRTLSAPPIVKGNTVMIPIDMISQCFDASVSRDANGGTATITLNGDGALSDLSFLTGSLTKPTVGNSYFGWSIDIPKGSRVIAQSFNSKEIEVENLQHGIDIDISAKLDEGKSLDKYYEELTDDPYAVLKADLMDSSLNLQANPAFIDLLYTDAYDEAIYQRIYSNGKYFYNITVTSYDESDPGKLAVDKSVKELLGSFKMGYKGGVSETTDLSSVKFGLADYNNYISSDTTGKKYSTWEMKVSPDWDQLPQQGSEPYRTDFGLGASDKVTVEISHNKDLKDIAAYGESMKAFYQKNFNPGLFSMVSAGASKVAGLDAYSMTYDVTLGKNKYRYDERYLVSGSLLYDITMKARSDSYKSKVESFQEMLDSFVPSAKPADELLSDMDKHQFTQEKNRVNKDDRVVSYDNKNFGWSMSLPGYWQKNSAPGLSLENFYDLKSGAMVTVESIGKDTGGNGTSDQDRFDSMKMVADKGLDPLKVDSMQFKGKNVKVYKYRLEDEANDNYEDLYYYVIDGESHSYCYTSSIPDISSSPANLKTLNDIWNSFTISEKAADKN